MTITAHPHREDNKAEGSDEQTVFTDPTGRIWHPHRGYWCWKMATELAAAHETITTLERTIQNSADMISGAQARADHAEASLSRVEQSYQEMKAAALHYEELHRRSKMIVDRIWELFGTPTYAELDGRSIFDLVREAIADAKRYRYLRDHCGSHYPMTQEQPAEWSIGWEFQQGTPDERYGSFDHWIDRDIETAARVQAEIDAEDEQTYVAAMHGEPQ